MNTDAKRYYALLGLDPLCSDEDIRSAFRRRAKELHPDAGSGDATSFIRLKRAYDTLGDPTRRGHYDRLNNPRVRRAIRPAPLEPAPPRLRPRRPGGMSFRRYFVAFLFVGGLSFGAIETMISFADVPSAGLPHPVSLLTSGIKAAAINDDKQRTTHAKSGSGFWDPSSPNGTPRDDMPDGRGASDIHAESLGTTAPE